MPTKFTLTIDCADPDKLVRFWTKALGYTIEGPPAGFDTWWAYWKSKGLPDEENYAGNDAITDPNGGGPRIWFHQVPEKKVVKNRLHLDLQESGGRAVPLAIRKRRVDAAAERLVTLGGKILEKWDESEINQYAVAMQDPEGNEFDIY
jgi:catechol 2,3-dioxygenase-like lactoylglutathione lyase family enzyme